MRISKAILIILPLLTPVSAAVSDDDIFDDTRNLISTWLGITICTAGSPATQAFCAASLATGAKWLDKGVELAIDRHFQTEDQEFANENGITICYKDGTCIIPE